MQVLAKVLDEWITGYCVMPSIFILYRLYFFNFLEAFVRLLPVKLRELYKIRKLIYQTQYA